MWETWWEGKDRRNGMRYFRRIRRISKASNGWTDAGDWYGQTGEREMG